MVHHVAAAILIREDKILLGQRSPTRAFYPDVWDVFGGHIEPDEQPEQALIRELQEELDITPKQWIELETISETVPERDGMLSHDLVARFYLIMNWVGTPINRQSEEHSVIQWFSYEEAIKLDLAHPAYPRLFAECLQWIADNKQ